VNRTVVITGATSGIGEQAAVQLAARGVRIVLVARDALRRDATLARLRAVNPVAPHAAHLADLSSIAEMKQVAADIARTEPHIDVLINNAGAVFMGRQRTVDHLAPSFALNHLSYYVLTLLLLRPLLAAPAPRVVCTSSRAHRLGRLNFDRLQVDGIAGYAASKLANLLFVRRLSQLAGQRLLINACHPGFVASRFADNTGLAWRTLMRWRKRLHGRTPAAGAGILLHLAESPELHGRSGLYFTDEGAVRPHLNAENDLDAQRLWNLSAQLTGVNWSPQPVWVGDYARTLRR
jgi:NAD(P)-dependent dehydrogenase (short-subunit alcohol dehydrogenase family)